MNFEVVICQISYTDHFYPIKACESRQNQFRDTCCKSIFVYKFGYILCVFSYFGYICVYFEYLDIFGYISEYILVYLGIFVYIRVYSKTNAYVPLMILPQLKVFLHGYIREFRDK